MKELYRLVTSNKNKIKEFSSMGVDNVRIQLGEDVGEVDADPWTVVIYKALSAGYSRIVEDTSLDVVGADVGVNVRWLMDTLPQHVGKKATWTSLIAVNEQDYIDVYEGSVQGIITLGGEKGGFGFDSIFVPNGYTQNLTELKRTDPTFRTARQIAIEKFKYGETIAQIDKWTIPMWDGAIQQG